MRPVIWRGGGEFTRSRQVDAVSEKVYSDGIREYAERWKTPAENEDNYVEI